MELLSDKLWAGGPTLTGWPGDSVWFRDTDTSLENSRKKLETSRIKSRRLNMSSIFRWVLFFIVTQLLLFSASFASTKWRCLTSRFMSVRSDSALLSFCLWFSAAADCTVHLHVWLNSVSTVLDRAAGRLSVEAVMLHSKIMLIRPAELTGAPAARSGLTGREVIHF